MEVFKLFGTILIDNDKANKSLSSTDKNAQKSSNSMSKAFKKIGTALVAAFSVAKIIEFGKACINAYKVQNEAETKLETVMRQRMKASDDSIQSIKDYASELQKVGVVGDEVQLSGAQQLATFLKTDKALKTLMPAMNNLAVQQNGVNVSSEKMVSIGNMFGKVMQGQTSALSRVGISFDANQEKILKYGTEEERAAVLAEVITQNVGNMNEIMAKTDDGKMQQAKNTLGDLQEVIGEKLIPIQTLWYQGLAMVSTFLVNGILPIVNNVVKIFNNFTQSLSKNNNIANTFKSIYQTYVVPLISNLKQLGETLYQSWLILWPGLQNLFIAFASYLQTAWEQIGKPVFDVMMMVVAELFDIFNKYLPLVAKIVSDVFTLIGQYWTKILQPKLVQIGTYVRTVLLPAFTVVFGAISGAVRSAFNIIGSLWNNSLKPILNGVISFVSNVFKGNFTGAFKNIISIVKGIWNGIKTIITSPIETAKNIVKGIIDKIKGFFNFSIKWPKIPMPHFGVTPKGWGVGDLLKGKIPKLSIDWYAEGGLMKDITPFGINGDKIMVGGERETEAIAPLSELENYYRKWSANDILEKKLDQLISLLQLYLPLLLASAEKDIYLNDRTLVGKLLKGINEGLNQTQLREARGL